LEVEFFVTKGMNNKGKVDVSPSSIQTILESFDNIFQLKSPPREPQQRTQKGPRNTIIAKRTSDRSTKCLVSPFLWLDLAISQSLLGKRFFALSGETLE
jgi:hypothetical protein